MLVEKHPLNAGKPSTSLPPRDTEESEVRSLIQKRHLRHRTGLMLGVHHHAMPAGQPKRAIELEVAKNNDDLVALFQIRFESGFNQLASDALPLMTWQHGHRGVRQGVHRSNFCSDGDSSEQDVTDNLAVYCGDERDLDVATISKSIDEIGLHFGFECLPVHVPDSLTIRAFLGANDYCHDVSSPLFASSLNASFALP